MLQSKKEAGQSRRKTLLHLLTPPLPKLLQQLLSFERNPCLFYYALTVNVPAALYEVDWGLAAVRKAYRSLSQILRRQGLTIEYRAFVRMYYISRIKNIFKPGEGRYHIHALLSSEVELSGKDLAVLEKKLLKNLNTEDKKAVETKPIRSLERWNRYILEENILLTKNPRGVRVRMLTFRIKNEAVIFDKKDQEKACKRKSEADLNLKHGFTFPLIAVGQQKRDRQEQKSRDAHAPPPFTG